MKREKIRGIFGLLIVVVIGAFGLAEACVSRESSDSDPKGRSSATPDATESPDPGPSHWAPAPHPLDSDPIRDIAAPFRELMNECAAPDPETSQREIGLNLEGAFSLRCWGNDLTAYFISFRNSEARGAMYGHAAANPREHLQGMSCENRMRPPQPEDVATNEIAIQVCFRTGENHPAIYWQFGDTADREARSAGVLIAPLRTSPALLSVWAEVFESY